MFKSELLKNFIALSPTGPLFLVSQISTTFVVFIGNSGHLLRLFAKFYENNDKTT